MGVTLQWREPPDRENRSFGRVVNFGGRRDGGAGYMALSDRVGPGVMLVHSDGLAPWLQSTADRLNEAGFTVLVPRLPLDSRSATTSDVVFAAADFLLDNWHPELGIVMYAAPDDRLTHLVKSGKAAALVAYDGIPEVDSSCPLLLHLPASIDHSAYSDLRRDVEVHVYEGTVDGFADAGSAAFDDAAAVLAEERSVDFLAYYLS